MKNHRLDERYNEIYHYNALDKPSDNEAIPSQIEPLQYQGWPTDGRQALVHLARRGGRLLEIGCGCGETLMTLADEFDEVVGLDLSSIRIERAAYELRHVSNCELLNATVEQITTKDIQPFDCIIWTDVIEHVVDVIGTMQAIANLSKIGTQLITATPNIAFLPHRWNAVVGKAPTTSWLAYKNEGFVDEINKTILLDSGHLHYFTFSQIETLYQIVGFRPDKRLGLASRFSRLRNFWPSLLSSLVCISGTFVGEQSSIHTE